jgi:hypothetical protein
VLKGGTWCASGALCGDTLVAVDSAAGANWLQRQVTKSFQNTMLPIFGKPCCLNQARAVEYEIPAAMANSLVFSAWSNRLFSKTSFNWMPQSCLSLVMADDPHGWRRD